MLSLNVLFVQALLGLATCPTVNDHPCVISDTLLKHQTFFPKTQFLMFLWAMVIQDDPRTWQNHQVPCRAILKCGQLTNKASPLTPSQGGKQDPPWNDVHQWNDHMEGEVFLCFALTCVSCIGFHPILGL